MPITPLHFSAFIFLYFKDKKRVDPIALAVSTTFIDLEPLYYLLLRECPTHRVWHGFTSALTIYPILVTLGVYFLENLFGGKLWIALEKMGLDTFQVNYPILNIYLISLFGGLSHIFLDMFTHEQMSWVLYPFTYGNPFYIGEASTIVEILVILLTIYSLSCWLKDKRSASNIKN
ncbi:MAG: DUF4184 family protein [Candidatus Bathyarchaeia archaeon]